MIIMKIEWNFCKKSGKKSKSKRTKVKENLIVYKMDFSKIITQSYIDAPSITKRNSQDTPPNRNSTYEAAILKPINKYNSPEISEIVDISKDSKADYNTLINNKYISINTNEFILRTYYRIIEKTCTYVHLYYLIMKLIYDYCMIEFKGDNYVDDIVEKIKKDIAENTNRMKAIFMKLDLDLDVISFTFSNLVKILDNDNIIFFKKYCKIQQINKYDHLKCLLYNNIPKPICYRSIPDKPYFYNCIIDKNRLRYDKNIKLQTNEFSFYQTICQPLQIRRYAENGRLADFYNNQEKTDDHAPNNVICENIETKTKEYKYNIKNLHVDKSVEYDEDIYLPKLTSKKLIKYSLGLKKNLTQDINPNDEYKKHILDKQNYKSGGSGIKLSLLEQIKHTDMCIKRLKTNIKKVRLDILRMKTYNKTTAICGGINSSDISNGYDEMNQICDFLKKIKVLGNDTGISLKPQPTNITIPSSRAETPRSSSVINKIVNPYKYHLNMGDSVYEILLE